MAEPNRDPREMVFCHQCENEWFRDEHGLQCPRCQSEIVEIIESGNDPRDTHDEPSEPPQPSEPPNPLLTHNPWDENAPDPDEGDISEVQWSGPGGMHFTRISVRSGPGRRGVPPMENFPALFSAMLGAPPSGRSGPDTRQSSGMTTPFGQFGPPAGFGGPRSPLQEGPSRQGFSTFHTTRLYPRDANSPQPQGLPVDDLSGILTTLLQGLHGAVVNAPGGGPNAQMSPLSIIHQMLNPANARSGDAVYTQEALDRVISQLMEQHSTSSAPGPASESAISSLPKVKLDESQLDSNGKAECSICMDSLSVGDEVTELPCKHWFHGDCVGAWLREHDTCPQCRRGIMPKDGDRRAPRSPGQMPMNMQTPWGGGYFAGLSNMMTAGRGPAGADDSGSGSQQDPHRVLESPASAPSGSSSGPSRPQPSSRRTSTHSQHSGRTSGGGISGWMGRHFGSSGGSGGNTR
ncbi:hypothetical protein MMC15_002111 [Xylographa vitiligo]|nr:hypothetical protein [Xylographa vitiligo]